MKLKQSSKNGFTILEMIIAISILSLVVMFSGTLLRNSVDARFALAERSATQHRASMSLQRISSDIQHAFIVQQTDQQRNPGTRKNNGIFRIEKNSSGDELTLTTMTKSPFVSNAKESDTSLVVYKLEDDKENIGRKKLMRGETKRIPDDLKEEVPLQVFASNIKALSLKCWRGDDWSNEPWDSTRSVGDGTRGKMPHMVMIEIEAFETDPTLVSAGRDSSQESGYILRTIVALPNAFPLPEIKPMATNIKWNPW